MPSGMEIDAIDAIAETIVRAQFGNVAVRLPRQFLHMRRADRAPRLVQPLARPFRAENFDDLLQNGIAAERVVIDEWRRLVQDFVRPIGEGVEAWVDHDVHSPSQEAQLVCGPAQQAPRAGQKTKKALSAGVNATAECVACCSFDKEGEESRTEPAAKRDNSLSPRRTPARRWQGLRQREERNIHLQPSHLELKFITL